MKTHCGVKATLCVFCKSLPGNRESGVPAPRPVTWHTSLDLVTLAAFTTPPEWCYRLSCYPPTHKTTVMRKKLLTSLHILHTQCQSVSQSVLPWSSLSVCQSVGGSVGSSLLLGQTGVSSIQKPVSMSFRVCLFQSAWSAPNTGASPANVCTLQSVRKCIWSYSRAAAARIRERGRLQATFP